MPSELISKQISKFFISDLGDSCEADKQYFTKHKSLNFKQIYDTLLDSSCTATTEIFQELSYDRYLSCFESLKPVFRRSVDVVREIQIETLNTKWLGNSNYNIQTGSKETAVTGNVEILLLLTAMLEYALGCVYFTLTNQRSPPHLLRDLLRATELIEFFGNEAITFLQILLGSPNSINLRNIVWHGFPKPDDIPIYYVTILLLIIHSLGNILEGRQLKLIYRTQVQNFDQFTSEIITDLSIETVVEFKKFDEILENYSRIDREYKIYWRRLLSLRKDQKYSEFIVLVLPQIELILRIKYSEINNFDASAKLDEYYITMDTIFEPLVPNKSSSPECNKLISSDCNLKEGALKLLFDLFIAPNGPRLRDKVGHGEVTRTAINDQRLCDILLNLSFSLMSGDDVVFSLNDYESKFHLNCRTKVALNDLNIALNRFSVMHLCSRSSLQSLPNDMKVKIFLRPKKESIYMLSIFKIANFLIKTCQNYEESVTSCQMLLAQQLLRSRRRRTLTRLIDALPNIHKCLQSILECLMEVFEKLQTNSFEDDIENCDQLSRFLKRSLKISENFFKYSQMDCNEWIKGIELCSAFADLREKFFEC